MMKFNDIEETIREIDGIFKVTKHQKKVWKFELKKFPWNILSRNPHNYIETDETEYELCLCWRLPGEHVLD